MNTKIENKLNFELNRVYEMDCIKFLKLLPDNYVNLIIIDPPYNELPKDWDNFREWDILKVEFERVLNKTGQLYIFGKQPMLSDLYHEFKDKFDFRFEIVWSKNRATWSTNYAPMCSHELIWCFKKKCTKTKDLYYDIDSIKTPGEPYVRKNKVQSTVRNNWKANHTIFKDGRRFPLSVICHPPVTRKNKIEGQPHPTQKPLFILEYIIKSSCKPDGIVLDCFMGSGSTAIASLNLKRNFIGCDIVKDFVILSESRILKFKNNTNNTLF